jgi:hypothetical protein
MKSKPIVALLTLILLASAVYAAEPITKVYIPERVTGAGGRSTVAVYSLEFGHRVAEVQCVPGAGAAFINGDSSEVWVFSATGNTCDVINTSTDKVIKTIAVGTSVFAAAFTPDGKYCFGVGAPAYGEHVNSITVIDCTTYEAKFRIGSIVDPIAVAVTPDSRFLYYVSGSGQEVGKLVIPSYDKVETVDVGFSPAALAFTHDGRYLLVACKGLDDGRHGGAQISVIDVDSNELYWIFSMDDGAPNAMALLPDDSRLFATFDTGDQTGRQNVISFGMQITDDEFEMPRQEGWTVGKNPRFGLVTPGGHFWLGSDAANGDLYAIDIEADSLWVLLKQEREIAPVQMAAVAIDVDERIAQIEAKIATTTDPAAIAAMRLDIAYLLQTAGRENDVIVAYQGIANTFPESFAAIQAKVGLSDLAYQNGLFSQAADYSYNALAAYARYLHSGATDQYLTAHQMQIAIDRLVKASDQLDKDYISEIAKAYLKVSVKRPELAEMFYRLGVELHKRDEKKLSRDCFTEVKNQLVNLNDLEFVRNLSAKLDLTTGDSDSRYTIDKRKKEPIVDGNLADWEKADPLRFDNDSRLTYNGGLWLGFADLTGQIYMEYTKEYLYIAGSIKDDSLVRTEDNIGDHVGVYFDFRPESGDFFTRSSTIGDGCFEVYVDAPGGPSPKATVSLSVAAPYQIASQKTEVGYDFELALPLNMFGKWLPDRRDRFGLGVELVDYDDPNDLGRVKAMGFMIPRNGPNEPLDPKLYGYGELK